MALAHRQVGHQLGIVVGSVALSLAVLVSPPPATVAVFVTLAGELLATSTVNVNAG